MLDLSPHADELSGATDGELSEWRDAATDREPPMQVKLTLKGPWHRPLARRGETACAKKLGGYATRDDSLEGDLCKDGCFSPHEFVVAAEERDARERARLESQREEDVEDLRELDELTRRRRSSEIEPIRKG